MNKRAEWLAKHPLLNKVPPSITEAKATKAGEQTTFTVKLTDATRGGWLFYRVDRQFAFKRVPLFDDGTNGDIAAGDGIFSATLESAKVKQWYIAAENDNAAATLPERASFEFFKID